MDFCLFDPLQIREQLLPFTFLRPCSEIRVGILTIKEKWENFLSYRGSWLVPEYLSTKYPFAKGTTLFINGAIIPEKNLVSSILNLNEGESLYKDEILIAKKGNLDLNYSDLEAKDKKVIIQYSAEISTIERPWDIFSKNGEEILKDLKLLQKKPGKVEDPFTRIYSPENVYIEEGAEIKAAIINAEAGPVFIGKNAKIHAGSILYGPLAILDGAQINPGAKIRSNTTIGPFCKVGGEVNNVVFFGYSNKGHDGFLGNAVIGEWCNLGADTNNSNLKNNYEEVKVWSYPNGRFIKTGKQFCGLLMGDHSKCAINTMFNTGTLVGIGANIFGAGFPNNFIPSFSWGGPQGRTTFRIDKMFNTADLVLQRRGLALSEEDKAILEYVYNETSKYRNWEKA